MAQRTHSSCNEACAGTASKRLGRLSILTAAAALSCSLAGCQTDNTHMADSRVDRIDRADRVDQMNRRSDYRDSSTTYATPHDNIMYGYLDDGIGFYQDNYFGD